jgi:hypothetical protein
MIYRITSFGIRPSESCSSCQNLAKNAEFLGIALQNRSAASRLLADVTPIFQRD